MEWTVYFVDEDMVETVPIAWLQDNVCYWPPYIGKRLNHAISTCEEPVFGTWRLFKIQKLGNGRTYDNLLKARAKTSIAEDTSKLASDLDGKRIPKNLYNTNETQSALSESSSDSEVAAPVQFPVLQPSTSKDKKSITITKDIETTINEPIKSNNVKNVPEYTIKTVHCNENKVYSNQSDKTDIEFQRQVLRQLQIINLRQTQMSEDIQTIMIKIVMQDNDKILLKNDEESIFNKFAFPLKSISELTVEEFLSDENNSNLFVHELTKIGGFTYKYTVKRIMSKLFSNEVAKDYSWIGFKGKNKFSLLRIAAVIITAVQKTHNSITLCDIEAVIKAWLVKAKFRNPKKTT